MPEDENDLTPEGGNENPNIRQLREKAERADAAEAARVVLEREVALLKSGIDTDHKLGQLFAKSYEGDVTDVEKLVADAKELGIPFKGQTPPATEGSVEGTPSEEPDEPTGSDQRRELANGAPADGGEQPHPMTVAEAKFKDAMSRGVTFEEAAGEVVHTLAQAAMAGDKRVIVEEVR